MQTGASEGVSLACLREVLCPSSGPSVLICRTPYLAPMPAPIGHLAPLHTIVTRVDSRFGNSQCSSVACLVVPGMPAEASHRECLRLVAFGASWPHFLRHSLTGEVVQLETYDVLDFDEEGVGFVACSDDTMCGDLVAPQVAWANDFLDLSYHLPEPGAERSEPLVFSKKTGLSEWAGDLEARVEVLSFKHLAGGAAFAAEVYYHHLPKAGVCFWWAAPWLQDAVFGSNMHNRWICRQYDQWHGITRTDGSCQMPPRSHWILDQHCSPPTPHTDHIAMPTCVLHRGCFGSVSFLFALSARGGGQCASSTSRHAHGFHPTLAIACRTMGINDAERHFRRSAKSLAAVAKKNGNESDGNFMASAEQEFSFTTTAAICLLVFWSVPPPQSLTGNCEARCRKAQSALGIIVDALLGDNEWSVVVSCGAFVVSKGKVDLAQALARCDKLGKLATCSDMCALDFLCWVGSKAHRGSRVSHETKMQARLVLSCFCKFLGMVVEVFGRTATLFEKSSFALPVLHLRTSRPRRLSSARKLGLAKQVQCSAGVRRVGQFVASQGILAKAGVAPKTVHHRSADRFVRDNLFHYYLSSRKFWAPLRHVSIVADCGRVSGHDLMMNVAFSCERRKGSWGPPQASWGRRNTTFGGGTSISVTSTTSVLVTSRGLGGQPT